MAGILHFIRNLFTKKHKMSQLLDEQSPLDKEFHLEPKYWQEVMDFIDKINELIKTHTIEDNNIQQVNQRIVDYIKEQINVKGEIKDIEVRYAALDTLADRILANSLNKIVGLKHSDNSRAEFSHTVAEFKRRLHQRHQAELAYNQKS